MRCAVIGGWGSRLALAALALGAGAAAAPPAPDSAPVAAQSTVPARPANVPSTRGRMGQALTQPFNDLNVMRSTIAPVLVQAAAAPYERARDCETISTQLAQLDAALGPDVDAPVKRAGMVRSATASLAVDALRGATTGWIPLRGVVRRVTGAEAHAEAARRAVMAGMARRAYLKGVGEQKGCFEPVVADPPVLVADLDAPPTAREQATAQPTASPP